MPDSYLRRALELSSRHGFVIASDECYSELYFDEASPPTGLLQAAFRAGNTDSSAASCPQPVEALERAGPALGVRRRRREVPRTLPLYRTYHGCAVPAHTQLASVPAWNDEAHVVENRRLYREKFARVTPVIAAALQQDIAIPAGGFYLWPRVGDDEAFTRELFAQQHVTVLPGRYLARETGSGNPGLGRIRISLVASLDDCDEAALRIAKFVQAGIR